jgi:hypothetical protein
MRKTLGLPIRATYQSFGESKKPEARIHMEHAGDRMKFITYLIDHQTDGRELRHCGHMYEITVKLGNEREAEGAMGSMVSGLFVHEVEIPINSIKLRVLDSRGAQTSEKSFSGLLEIPNALSGNHLNPLEIFSHVVDTITASTFYHVDDTPTIFRENMQSVITVADLQRIKAGMQRNASDNSPPLSTGKNGH